MQQKGNNQFEIQTIELHSSQGFQMSFEHIISRFYNLRSQQELTHLEPKNNIIPLLVLIIFSNKYIFFDQRDLIIYIFYIIRNNSRPKKMRVNDKKQNSHHQMPIPSDQFGLGIQVFKIESSKVAQEDRTKQRKIIKNIQHPVFAKPSAIVAKKPNVLPSLSVQRKVTSLYQEEPIKQRKKTVQKKKIAFVADPIKQTDEKKLLQQKKQDFIHQSLKNMQPDQTVLATKQREITQVHYRKSFNELLKFNIKLQEIQMDNLREIKKLRKQKQRDQKALQYLVNRKQDKKLLIQSVVQVQDPYFPYDHDDYDEFDMVSYVDNGFKFKHYDVVETFDY